MKNEFEQNLDEQRKAVLEQLEKWHTESAFEINGREYQLSKLSHQFRVEVISVYSQIEAQLVMGNYGFFNNPDFVKIMKKVDEKVLFDSMQLSKKPNHFEEFPEDYLDYVATVLKVICFPLYRKKLDIN